MNFSDVKKFVNENRDEVDAVIEAERQAIYNSVELKILLGKYLSVFWESRTNKKLTFVFYFTESDFAKLSFGEIKTNLDSVISERLKTHRIIKVDHRFGIEDYKEELIERDKLIELSAKRNIVIFFGENGIDVVLSGKFLTRINIFYDELDRLQYKKKYHIQELQFCINDYAVFIQEPGNNEAFFASKNLIARLQPIRPPNNTLHNRPEKLLRDSLLSFLNRNTQHTFSKENELSNLRELDLYTEVDGKKYLIEVKWLGQSINDTETGFSEPVTDHAARKGVTQTLEYIQELIMKMSYNVHTGYLCVFDAREVKKTIDYQSFSFIAAELMPYWKHFIKLEEIPIDRN